MSEPDNKKTRRTLKNLPPDRFQPKMLLFWLALVAAVIALLVFPHGSLTTPETLTIQEVVDRAEARDVDRKSTRLNSSHVSESRMPSSA